MPPSAIPPSPPSSLSAPTSGFLPRSTAPPPPPTAAAAPAATAASGAHDVTGPVVRTQFGDVQVKVSLAGSRIVDVQALELPTDRARSAFISDYAAPRLRSEAIQAQNADIDIISGATYTSLAYARSLSSALSQAGL